MRLHDRANAGDCGRVVEQHSAAAINLPIDQPRSQNAAVKIMAFRSKGLVGQGRYADDQIILNEQSVTVDHTLAVKQTRAGKCFDHGD